jgi:UrcA family protein
MNRIVNRQFAVSTLVAIATTFAIVSSVQSAPASGMGEAISRTVQFGDLNLDTTPGAKVFVARLRSAARTACAPLDTRALSMHAAWQSCYEGAVASAVSAINRDAVTTVYVAGGGTLPISAIKVASNNVVR